LVRRQRFKMPGKICRIVNHRLSLYPDAGMQLYAASKAAIKLFTAVMAREGLIAQG